MIEHFSEMVLRQKTENHSLLCMYNYRMKDCVNAFADKVADSLPSLWIGCLETSLSYLLHIFRLGYLF